MPKPPGDSPLVGRWFVAYDRASQAKRWGVVVARVSADVYLVRTMTEADGRLPKEECLADLKRMMAWAFHADADAAYAAFTAARQNGKGG